MSNQQGQKRGRPPTSPVDRLRAKVWYQAVKARGEWSDYRLDVEFVRSPGEEKRDGFSRRRCFEGIRRYGRVPSSGNHRARKYDLVAQVDSHPSFAGTAAVFRSPFWDLLKTKVMNLADAHAFVCTCLGMNKCFRASEELDTMLKNQLRQMSRGKTGVIDRDMYEGAIDAVLEGRPIDLDLLALVGALFREAYLACALDTAIVLRDTFLALLSQYCGGLWLGDLRRELLNLGERRMLYWYADADLNHPERDCYDGNYDDWPEIVVNRIILPLNETTMSLVEVESAFLEAKRRDANSVKGSY